MGERTITGWSTSALRDKLNGLSLADGVTIGDVAAGWVTGEVSIGDRKGKSFPIYSLEVEVPFSGTVNGAAVSGTVHLPDVSLEMLDDLEVELNVSSGDGGALASDDVVDKVRAAVKGWAAGVRKAVGESLDTLPLDPPTQARTPRAAALISEEESMSAGGAAELDDAGEGEIEELPHPDDVDGEGEGEEEPFTEEEVSQLYEDAVAALREVVDGDDLDVQLKELDAELEGKETQDRGRVLVEVLEYLRNPQEGEGEDGEDGPTDLGPYESEEQLQKLYEIVRSMCVDEDLPRLEEEIKGKGPEEQWRILCEVRSYLLGEGGGEEGDEGEEGDDMTEEEAAAFDAWKPSAAELASEWRTLMQRVPADEAAEVEPDFEQAGPDDRKRMVWDVRKFLEQDADDEEPDPTQPQKKPPPRPPTDAELGGRNEVRRRGGAARGREYERAMEYGFGDQQGNEWNEYHDKELRGSQRGRSPLMLAAGCVLVGGVVLLTSAAVFAEEDEALAAAALRLIRLG
mmetsp:Transcript_50553/g.131527  ORF Transcript_50553/g.131527 Transcript_50553/m.131527 type:complete len:514 (+) Transcript_50553:32-1573(+)